MTVVPARAASWSRRRIRSARDDRFPVQAGSLRASVGRGPGRLLVRARTGAPAFLPLPVPEIPAPAPQGLLLCVRQRNGEPTAEPVRLRESGFEFRRGQRGSACAEILDQCAEGAKQRVGRCPRLLIAHPLLELPHQTGDRLTVPGREPQGVEGPHPTADPLRQREVARVPGGTEFVGHPIEQLTCLRGRRDGLLESLAHDRAPVAEAFFHGVRQKVATDQRGQAVGLRAERSSA